MKHILKELQRIIGKEDANVTIREKNKVDAHTFQFSNTKKEGNIQSVEETHRIHDGYWEWEQPSDNITF